MTSSTTSFPRALRLDGPHAYTAVFAFKCSVAGAYFRVYAKPSAAAQARLGVVVSKSLEARAVGRNACKRLAREVFRGLRVNLPRLDFVVRSTPAIPAPERARARQELQQLLPRAGRRCVPRAPLPDAAAAVTANRDTPEHG